MWIPSEVVFWEHLFSSAYMANTTRPKALQVSAMLQAYVQLTG